MKKEPEFEKWNEMDITGIISDLMGRKFKCPECGKTHSMDTRKMVLSKDVFNTLSGEIKDLGLKGKCLVVFDKNTRNIAGERLMNSLRDFSPEEFVFLRDDLHADSFAVGRLLIAMKDNPDFLVSCGSGTITDITRYTAHMTKKPFVAFGTAASMDGYASSSTPLIVDGFKTTYPGCAPVGIFADTGILSEAPKKMTAAGFGDVLAKTIAVMDWKLAKDTEDEPYCPLISSLVEKAVNECINLSEKLFASEPSACGKLMEVLSLTGIAMQMMGSSRPASGAEHHISHLLEMRDIQQGKKGSLHGDKVGIGTLISLYIYQKMFSGKMPEQRNTMGKNQWEREVRRVYGDLAEEAISRNDPEPPGKEIWDDQKRRLEAAMLSYGFGFAQKAKTLLPEYKKMISDAGGPCYPHELGYTVEDTYDAIAFGKEVRPKFTLLRIAERFGHLYDLADEISRGLAEGKIY